VRSVTALPRPASPKEVGSAGSGASGSPRPRALALHVLMMTCYESRDYATLPVEYGGRASDEGYYQAAGQRCLLRKVTWPPRSDLQVLASYV
jgi:hypothetical protein